MYGCTRESKIRAYEAIVKPVLMFGAVGMEAINLQGRRAIRKGSETCSSMDQCQMAGTRKEMGYNMSKGVLLQCHTGRLIGDCMGYNIRRFSILPTVALPI